MKELESLDGLLNDDPEFWADDARLCNSCGSAEVRVIAGRTGRSWEVVRVGKDLIVSEQPHRSVKEAKGAVKEVLKELIYENTPEATVSMW